MNSSMPMPPQRVAARTGLQFCKPEKRTGHRIALYGPGGIGKTTLAASLPGPVVFFDLDESLGVLGLDADVISVRTWQDIRTALQSEGWDGIKSIVIDTATKAEELAVAHTLATVKQEGKTFASVEAYGYGKGYGYVYDTFLPLLADLDGHVRAGRNVVLVCHDCIATVPNPGGEDWIRYEPRLQSPTSGKASIRLRVREWADHVLFVCYDVAVDKDGKGQGAGSRTMYRAELPSFMAKSRTGAEPIVIDGQNIWEKIGVK